MTKRDLHQAAKQAGLAISWQDAFGKTHRTDPDVLQALLHTLQTRSSGEEKNYPSLLTVKVGETTSLPFRKGGPQSFLLKHEDGTQTEGKISPTQNDIFQLPRCYKPGYHTLELGGTEITLAVAPETCASLKFRNEQSHGWGLTVQIPALRQSNDTGIGHLGSVAKLAKIAGLQGADALMMSPLHALCPIHPERCSPYSPSSRRFLNPLLADLRTCFSKQLIHTVYRQHPDWAAQITERTAEKLINWKAAGTLRLQVLRVLYEKHIRPCPPQDMLSFIQEGGSALKNHAVFEALQAFLKTRGPRGDNWRLWEAPFKKPDTPEVARFAHTHQEEVGFWLFLQWLAVKSLKYAARTAREAGMPIGLIADIAVGLDPSGAECWSQQDNFLIGASIGAPPDQLAPAGQNWGLTTFSPQALQQNGYEAFIAMLRAGFAAGGGIRFDHVMGLERIWLIPDGGNSNEGTYLTMPQADLKNLLALESVRAGGMVIGEDLGTVPKGFRSRMAEKKIWGMNVMWFMKTPSNQFMAPAAWPTTGVAMTTTHDLPTVAGWWLEMDNPAQHARNKEQAPTAARQNERNTLWSMLTAATSKEDPLPMPPVSPAGATTVVDTSIQAVASTPCPLVLVPMEDFLGMTEQPNVPGDQKEHPNWRNRYPIMVKEIVQNKDIARRVAIIEKARIVK
nr:4-alpha-glucanotransferase [Acetobacter senegalensis]